MTEIEFFTEWKQKYSKSFEKFINYYNEKRYKGYFHNGYKSFGWKNRGGFWDSLPFEMLTGIIEKFFEENKISFFIVRNNDSNNKLYNKWYSCIIEDDIFLDIDEENNCYNNKKEAQMSAYLKAAEVLEKVLEAK